MSYYFKNLWSHQVCKYTRSLLVLLLFVSFAHRTIGFPQDTETPYALSKSTTEALDRVIKLNEEINSYGGSISELILKGSYVQDTLYSFLLKAENVGEFHRGMELFDEEMHNFRKVCNYISNVYNFYKGTAQETKPHQIKFEFDGQKQVGYLNTFKLDRHLTDEERENYFFQEYEQYLQDCIEKPFVLDASNIQTLEPDALYNYVLLPDGTIRVALEREGEREYHVRDEHVVEAFTHPNHTILAGRPDQVVMTAGAFIILQEGEKRLFFVSCKSGHFQPYYNSVHLMRPQLAELGINSYTVISVNDVDLSQSVLKTYKSTKIPIFISDYDTQRLFDIAQSRWNHAYESIDREVLTTLAKGDFSVINLELVETLKKQRAESTYMRSAYNLFSSGHRSPIWFSEFVKHYGKLKDLIKHYPCKELKYDKIKSKAACLIYLIDNYDREKDSYKLQSADTTSFFTFYNYICADILELLGRDSLSKEEFHDLKKLSREQYVFFLYLSEDVKHKSKGFFIYNTCAESFYQINDMMAKSDFIYAPPQDGEEYVRVPRKIANQLLRNIHHLSIAPPKFPLEFDSDEIKSMINSAKEVYTSAYYTYYFLQSVLKPHSAGSIFDYTEARDYFKWLLREAEIARHAFILFDISHQSPEIFDKLITKVKQFLQACEARDFEMMKEEAQEFEDLCYYGPDVLEDYVQTNQESLNQTLAAYISNLGFIKSQNILSEELAEHVAESALAFRDLMNLCRRNSLLKNVDGAEGRLPTVCFDVLEEQADILLEGLQPIHKNIEVTQKMKIAAEIISSRVDTRD